MFEIEQTDRYRRWFAKLDDRKAKSRIDTRLRRLRLGNPGDFRFVGNGVLELKVDYGPGYRIYYMRKAERLILLLAGGDKRTQSREYTNCDRIGGSVQERPMKKKQSKLKTYKWDPTEHIKTEKDVVAYLDAALDDGDPAIIAEVLGDIARSRGMAKIAKKTGLGRESLYKSLSKGGNPEFLTVLKVVHALGFKLRLAA